MELHISSLCDSASDYQGKLCLLGTFDTIYAGEFPVTHPTCALALRFYLKREDQGKHSFSIRLTDANDQAAGQPIESEMEVKLPNDGSSFMSRNLIINIQRLRFEQPGDYFFNILFDGRQLCSLPLRLVKVQQNPAAEPSA